MLKLIKLEWKKNNIGKYIRNAVILAIILCTFLFALAYLGIANDPDTGVPDAAPVILPIIIAIQNGYPNVYALLNPTIVNSAKPMVSKIKNVLFSRMTYFPNKITKNMAKAVQIRYIGSVIQAGVTSSSKSRIVPPPIAVANPTT